jgi:crotonobetaine/carnitine-CoA ligase
VFESFHLPPLSERTIATVLECQSSATPDKQAICDPGRSVTYGALFELAMKSAGAYAALGITRGEPVLLMLDNHCDAIIAWFGLSMLGAVEVPVNTAYIGAILEHVVDNSGAKTLVIEKRYLARIDALPGGRDRFTRLIVRTEEGDDDEGLVTWRETEGAGPALLHRNGPFDIAAIIYTSGTTGPSKGVITPEGHAYGYSTPAALGAPTVADVSFVALPLFHVGGHLCGVYSALMAGATAFIPPRFVTSTFWDEVNAVQATFATLVGAMVNFLMAQPPSPDDALTTLRSVALAPISGVTRKFLERFGLEGCCSGYGSTEASSPLCVPLGSSPDPFSLGWVRPDYEAAVMDENDLPVEVGAIGELVLRPREPWTMMAGYQGDPAKTVSAWKNLWYHTGDGVRQQPDDGQYILIDRLSDSIRRRGENISSYSVETIVSQHEDVIDCAAVGVPDELSGQEVLVVVVQRPGAILIETDLIEFLIDRLPHFMVPRYVRITDNDFERSPSGKIRKDLLRKGGVTTETWDRVEAGLDVRRV